MRSITLSRASALLSLAGVVLLAACNEGDLTAPAGSGSPTVSQATATVPPDLEIDVTSGDFRVCKVGSSADFTVSVEGGTADNPAFSLNDGDCALAHTDAGGDPDVVTITESGVQEGFRLDSIVIYAVEDDEASVVREGKVTGTNSVSGAIEDQKAGCTVIFYNSPIPEQPGTGTPGYWMNHPEAWPVAEITVGGVTYSRADAIMYMQMPVRGDKTLTMFPALVSAKLNVLVGNDDTCIADVISDADDWMADFGPVGSGVRANSDAWQDSGEELYHTLDAYNNGLLCAPSRDELENG